MISQIILMIMSERFPSDLLWAVLCHCKPVQVAPSVRSGGCQCLQRQEAYGGTTPYLLCLWQCHPEHAHWYVQESRAKINVGQHVWSTFLDKCNTLNVFFCRSAESVCLDHVSLNLMVLSWMIQHYVESSTLSKIWPHKNFMKNQTMEKNSKLPHFHTQWRIRCWKDCEHQTCHPVLCYHRSGFWQEEGPSPWKDSGML